MAAVLACGLVMASTPRIGALAHEAHKYHAAKPAQKSYTRLHERYAPPEVTLIDMHGDKVKLKSLLDGEAPVLLEFIFTTCATICPVLSASFASPQGILDRDGAPYRMISITIDPEHDTPRILREYAGRFEAGGRWHFLTGPRAVIERVQKAFDADYRGNNKMYHQPYTFLRGRKGAAWVRLEGLLGAGELLSEFRAAVGAKGSGKGKAL